MPRWLVDADLLGDGEGEVEMEKGLVCPFSGVNSFSTAASEASRRAWYSGCSAIRSAAVTSAPFDGRRSRCFAPGFAKEAADLFAGRVEHAGNQTLRAPIRLRMSMCSHLGRASGRHILGDRLRGAGFMGLAVPTWMAVAPAGMNSGASVAVLVDAADADNQHLD